MLSWGVLLSVLENVIPESDTDSNFGVSASELHDILKPSNTLKRKGYNLVIGFTSSLGKIWSLI